MNKKVIGICVYCDKTVREDEESLETKSLIHKDCENDIQAEIQAARGEW